jgi:hypothetical protein
MGKNYLRDKVHINIKSIERDHRKNNYKHVHVFRWLRIESSEGIVDQDYGHLGPIQTDKFQQS